MANLKTIGKRIGRGVVSVAPYALANAGAAFVADSGVNANAGVVEAEFLGSGLVPYVVVIMVEDESAKRDKFRGNYGIWGPKKSETLRSYIAEAGYWHLHDQYSEKDFKCKQHNGVQPQ